MGYVDKQFENTARLRCNCPWHCKGLVYPNRGLPTCWAQVATEIPPCRDNTTLPQGWAIPNKLFQGNNLSQSQQSPKQRRLSKYDELVTGLQTVTTAETFDDYHNFGLRLASNP